MIRQGGMVALALVVAEGPRVPQLLATTSILLRSFEVGVRALAAGSASIFLCSVNAVGLTLMLGELEARRLCDRREGLIWVDFFFADSQRHVEALRVLHLEDVAE